MTFTTTAVKPHPSIVSIPCTGDRFIYTSKDNKDEIIYFLLVDRATRTYDISLQRRGVGRLRVEFLGQIRPLHAEAWALTYVGRVQTQPTVEASFVTADLAALHLLQVFQAKKNAASKRERVAERELEFAA